MTADGNGALRLLYAAPGATQEDGRPAAAPGALLGGGLELTFSGTPAASALFPEAPPWIEARRARARGRRAKLLESDDARTAGVVGRVGTGPVSGQVCSGQNENDERRNAESRRCPRRRAPRLSCAAAGTRPAQVPTRRSSRCASPTRRRCSSCSSPRSPRTTKADAKPYRRPRTRRETARSRSPCSSATNRARGDESMMATQSRPEGAEVRRARARAETVR